VVFLVLVVEEEDHKRCTKRRTKPFASSFFSEEEDFGVCVSPVFRVTNKP